MRAVLRRHRLLPLQKLLLPLLLLLLWRLLRLLLAAKCMQRLLMRAYMLHMILLMRQRCWSLEGLNIGKALWWLRRHCRRHRHPLHM